MNVTNNWIELKVFFSLRGLAHTEAHGCFTAVEKRQFLAVDMTQQTNLKIVKLMLYKHRNLHAVGCKFDWNRR